MKTIDELQTVAVYARDRLNPFLFNYALSVALLHREDTKDLNIPLFIESFPEKFMDSKIFQRIREEAFLLPPELRKPIEIPKSFTASGKFNSLTLPLLCVFSKFEYNKLKIPKNTTNENILNF